MLSRCVVIFTCCDVFLVDINAVDRGTPHISWKEDVYGCHNAQNDAGFQDTNKVGRAFAFKLAHKLFPMKRKNRQNQLIIR